MTTYTKEWHYTQIINLYTDTHQNVMAGGATVLTRKVVCDE